MRFILYILMSFVCWREGLGQTNKEIAENFCMRLQNGNVQPITQRFSKALATKISSKDLNGIWKSLQAQFGNFRKQGNTLEVKNGHSTIFTSNCEFERAYLTLKISFEDTLINGLFFLPANTIMTYVKPDYVHRDRFIEKDIFVTTQNFHLSGKLVLPKSSQPTPLVIFVHGSGPLDKDETIGPNKIFMDLAYGLGSQGIASLRYDKRTFAYPQLIQKNMDSLSIHTEIMEDVLSAIQLGKTIPEIDAKQIYLLGHSLGGMLLPWIAKTTHAKGLIFMAANARPLEDLVLDQTAYLLGGDSLSMESKLHVQTVENQVKKVKSAALTPLTPKESLPLGLPAYYWLSLKGYDQLLTASQVKARKLFLQGKRDYQVTGSDFTLWKKSMDPASSTFVLYPRLNHLFHEGTGLSNPQEYLKPGHVAAYVIQDIVQWISVDSK